MTREELLSLINQASNEGWKELDLSGKGLTELPPEIGKLTQLETLILGTWAKEKKGSQGIKGYEVIGNRIVPLIVGNRLQSLPPELANLVNLRKLDISGNPWEKIPDVITQLRHLEQLTLIRLDLNEFPELITQLVNLTQLYLSDNQLTQVPESITKLVNLTQLDLSFNQLTQVPESITKLVNLTQLDLSFNQLTQVPESITQLVNLTQLDLSGNQLTQVPESITQLVNLTKLDLSRNQLTQVPESISQLVNLTQLDLSRNQLTQVPESITQLVNLTQLYLSRNQLTQVPESITQLVNLTQLYLSFNQLTQVPESITQLVNLTQLNLSANQITEIPNWLEELPNLNKLDLRQNPLPISPEILGLPKPYPEPGSIEKIFNYCRQLRSGNVLPLNEAKLLLIGQGSVGKTSLIKRLIDNTFDPNQSQTDGLNVTTWTIHVNSKDVRLNVWDFGGQEIYHATHQFFLTKRSLYLLVCNCRTSEEENRIEYWLKLIDSFGGQSPVIIVGNKKDEQPLDINRRALREKYPNIKAIIETSCPISEDDGIDELRQAITREVGPMRQTAAQFPQEIQDDIIVDIDDVEEEINKPENQRNLTRLRKRLIALATIGATIATPVAGITDFANNAIDLGDKLGIELQLPSAP